MVEALNKSTGKYNFNHFQMLKNQKIEATINVKSKDKLKLKVFWSKNSELLNILDLTLFLQKNKGNWPNDESYIKLLIIWCLM